MLDVCLAAMGHRWRVGFSKFTGGEMNMQENN